MKHLKIYEAYINNNKLPEDSLKIGDYVLYKPEDQTKNDDVCQIIGAYEYRKEKNVSYKYQYLLREYETDKEFWCYPQKLEFLTTNENEIKPLLAQRKYNL